ncbi:hypothetical protein B0H17DRAFT_1049896 [Mycena rosella]|uniref:Uncharacterized protein n=1 Tax=Mycena rosella TaxID=1033263 RepID=A0AAD7DTX0_MYCRO|nr:hypothetical protein B0H17DRAFT_1049896 [Mycena rosella]
MLFRVILLDLLLTITLMAPPTPGSTSSSLARRWEPSVREARRDAMQAPYASPRRRRLLGSAAGGGPFQDFSNFVLGTQDQGLSAGASSLERERSDLRDAERERHISLEETPSRRRRRIPTREEEENRAVSPTPGSQRVVAQLGTPLDTQAPPANNCVLAQHKRREREAAAKGAATASAGPSS